MNQQADFHWEKFFEKKNQNGRLNSQYFFSKILWVGPWISRIN